MSYIPAGTKRARQLAAMNAKMRIALPKTDSIYETPQEREIREWNERVERERNQKKGA